MTATDPILVIGGVGGMGEALTRRLFAEGRRPVITSRDRERASRLATELGLLALEVDVFDEASIANAVTAAAPDGRLAGLVYAVGSIPLRPLSRVTEADMTEAYRLNVVGAALAVKYAATALKAAQGSVVLFSSVAATQGFANHAIIGPAKAGVAGLALALAAELSPSVRVNAVAPSLSQTPLAQSIVGSKEMAEALAEMHPMKRLGTAEDSAALAAFLLSRDAGWITGQVIGVDGGRGSLRVGKA